MHLETAMGQCDDDDDDVYDLQCTALHLTEAHYTSLQVFLSSKVIANRTYKVQC